MTALLDVEDLTMRFGGVVAVGAMTFQAQAREITGVIGPNGAGKTTLFNCLTGFYRPTSGRALLTHDDRKNFHLERMPGFRIAREARVVRTFQNIRLFGGMTVLENLMVAQHATLMRASLFSVAGLLGLANYRSAERTAIERARYWLHKVGLTDKADQPAASLPYGSQRWLEIARAMCASPVLLCVDEPAAGLNARETEALNTLLLDIRREENIAILLIEHDMSVVMQICDHLVVLDHGAKIAQGTCAEVRANPDVIRAYLGAPDDEAVPVPA